LVNEKVVFHSTKTFYFIDRERKAALRIIIKAYVFSESTNVGKKVVVGMGTDRFFSTDQIGIWLALPSPP